MSIEYTSIYYLIGNLFLSLSSPMQSNYAGFRFPKRVFFLLNQLWVYIFKDYSALHFNGIMVNILNSEKNHLQNKCLSILS